MRLWWLCVTVLCGGCAHWTFPQALPENSAPPSAPVEVAPPKRGDWLQPARSVSDLLLQRLALCQDPDISQRIDTDSLGPVVPDVVDEARLTALLKASCRPAKTPGTLNQLLAELTGAGTWPVEYAAFFELLIAHQRAYALVEKLYLELKEEHGQLVLDYQQTIQGLSEIETDIDLHNSTSQP